MECDASIQLQIHSFVWHAEQLKSMQICLSILLSVIDWCVWIDSHSNDWNETFFSASSRARSCMLVCLCLCIKSVHKFWVGWKFPMKSSKITIYVWRYRKCGDNDRWEIRVPTNWWPTMGKSNSTGFFLFFFLLSLLVRCALPSLVYLWKWLCANRFPLNGLLWQFFGHDMEIRANLIPAQLILAHRLCRTIFAHHLYKSNKLH